MKTLPVRVTLVDVARDAGVSRATCSLVLQRSPLVAEHTRAQVVRSMERLGYIYHRGAAGLRTQRSLTVGLVIPDITNPFYAELTAGIESTLDAAGYVLVLGNTGEDRERQARVLATLHEHAADGLLFCPSAGTDAQVVQSPQRRQLPVVLLLRNLAGGHGDYIGADNVLGAAMATEHLIKHGHRSLAFLGGPAGSSARRERYTGFCDALDRHGLEANSALNVPGPASRAFGFSAALTMLARGDRPSAVLCYNDVVAFGVLLALQAAGMRAGVDCAVAGFDGVQEAALWRPSLTTISTSPRSIGAHAAELLLNRIGSPDAAPRHVLVPPRLIVRESCGCHESKGGDE